MQKKGPMPESEITVVKVEWVLNSTRTARTGIQHMNLKCGCGQEWISRVSGRGQFYMDGSTVRLTCPNCYKEETLNAQKLP